MSKSKKNQARTPKTASTPRTESAASISRREQLRAQQAADAQRARTKRIVAVAAGVLAFLIVAVVVVVLVQNAQRQKALEEQHGTGTQIVPAAANEAKDGIVYQGTADADAPLVGVYLDFQCGGCAQASQLIDPKLEELADDGEINLVYHMLYGLDAQPNGLSFRANVGASCAANYGAFDGYQKAVFNHRLNAQTAWTDDQLRNDFATAAGLTGEDLEAFQSCYDNKSTSEFVEGAQTAKPQIITQTPSFLVNGKLADLASASATKETLLAAIKAAA